MNRVHHLLVVRALLETAVNSGVPAAGCVVIHSRCAVYAKAVANVGGLLFTASLNRRESDSARSTTVFRENRSCCTKAPGIV